MARRVGMLSIDVAFAGDAPHRTHARGRGGRSRAPPRRSWRPSRLVIEACSAPTRPSEPVSSPDLAAACGRTRPPGHRGLRPGHPRSSPARRRGRGAGAVHHQRHARPALRRLVRGRGTSGLAAEPAGARGVDSGEPRAHGDLCRHRRSFRARGRIRGRSHRRTPLRGPRSDAARAAERLVDTYAAFPQRSPRARAPPPCARRTRLPTSPSAPVSPSPPWSRGEGSARTGWPACRRGFSIRQREISGNGLILYLELSVSLTYFLGVAATDDTTTKDRWAGGGTPYAEMGYWNADYEPPGHRHPVRSG